MVWHDFTKPQFHGSARFLLVKAQSEHQAEASTKPSPIYPVAYYLGALVKNHRANNTGVTASSLVHALKKSLTVPFGSASHQKHQYCKTSGPTLTTYQSLIKSCSLLPANDG